MGLDYGDLFADWEIAVAKRVVTQFQSRYPWLKGFDFDDLFQESLVHWYIKRAKYQESRGSSATAYMAMVINNRLQDLLRQELTDKRKASHLAESLDKPLAAEGEETLADVIAESSPDIAGRMDLESALNALTPSQRQICALLGQQYPVTKIAQILGKPRSTVRDQIKRIRQVFSEKGLTNY